MTVSEFEAQYPKYCLSFNGTTSRQRRIGDCSVLDGLPFELESIAPYCAGGRGRVNRNQTKTHRQCKMCLRVLRNDQFFWDNKVDAPGTNCKHCHNGYSRERYQSQAALLAGRRLRIWTALAPECVSCGCDIPLILEFHHVEDKTQSVAQLINKAASTPTIFNIQDLLSEVSKCVPLCPNCHRMVHYELLCLLPTARFSWPDATKVFWDIQDAIYGV